MIMGMIVPNSGAVVFEGMDVTKLPMYKRARLGIGYLSQEPSIFQRLSLPDNLCAILETLSIARAERDRKADMLIDICTNRGRPKPGQVLIRRRAKKTRNRPCYGNRPFADSFG